MIFYNRLNLDFNNSNLAPFSSFTFASYKKNSPFIYFCSSFLYHYLHNTFPDTDTKPGALSIVSSVKLLSMSITQEPPICLNGFNIFLLLQYNSKSTLFTNQSSLHLSSLIPTSTDTIPPFSTTYLTHLSLNPLTCPTPVRFSLTSCLLIWYNFPLIILITCHYLTLKSRWT